jgi:hypothetical protein
VCVTFHLLFINCDSHQELESHKKSKTICRSAHSDKLSQKTPQIATTKQERKCWIASVSFKLALVTVRKTRRKSNSSVTLNRLAYSCVDTVHKVDNSRKLPTNTESARVGETQQFCKTSLHLIEISVAGTRPDLLVLSDKKGKSLNVPSNGFTFQSAFSASTKKYKGKWFSTNRRAATYERN